MSATQIIDAVSSDDELAPWKSRLAEYLDLAAEEDDAAIWDDWGVVDALRRESDEQDHILSGLVRLMETSLSGYVEVLEFSDDPRVRCFAEIMVRQRAAQCADLRHSIDRERNADDFRHEAAELEHAWRLAIWNLEQDRQYAFLDRIEQAETLLEEALLTAAKAIRDDDWAHAMTDHAITVCGARDLWEELGQVLVDEPNRSAREPAATATP